MKIELVELERKTKLELIILVGDLVKHINELALKIKRLEGTS